MTKADTAKNIADKIDEVLAGGGQLVSLSDSSARFVLETLRDRQEFENVRRASRLFQEASDGWMDRALKAEEALAKYAGQTRATHAELRRLVDVVWRHATESPAVPSSKTAGMLITEAMGEPAPLLLPCPVCGGEAVHATDVLKRTIIDTVPTDKPNKVMTFSEYFAHPIDGWHSIHFNIDGLGGVGIRYHGVAAREGHNEPCYYCSQLCNSLAGDPSQWPVALCHRDEPGRVKWHHEGCVMQHLVENIEPVRLQARRAENTSWIDIYPSQLQWMAQQGYEVRAFKQVRPRSTENGELHKHPELVADDAPVIWPSRCHDPDSCARHQRCMYTPCAYKDQDITADIKRAIAAMDAKMEGKA